MTLSTGVTRSFRDLSDKLESDTDQFANLADHEWSGTFGWEKLLESKRILIVSEAGSGKTYECQQQAKMLWDAGGPAFFLELAQLEHTAVRDLLSVDQETRFDRWLNSQGELATFFLDSIDELNLTQGTLDQALRRFGKAIAGHLGRARIIMTSRPVPFDEQKFVEHLPWPQPMETEATGERFAHVAIHGRPHKVTDARPPIWRNVVLMPLSDKQVAAMAKTQRVTDVPTLLADIHKRNAQEFARRPQDLIEICADWNIHKRIRTHRDQVEANIRVKLKPRERALERRNLTDDKAYIGASKLALGLVLSRTLTIRHNADADQGATDVALDPATFLSDWTAEERRELLERPLFGFASYGRVRFHHRSVIEFLAADRLRIMVAEGQPIAAVRRLLMTTDALGEIIVRPSMRPVAAWLASFNDSIFEAMRDHAPEILLNLGDPESLLINQRIEALQAYVARYGAGGWRGLHVPLLQTHRFVSPDLAQHITTLWQSVIENIEVRQLLLTLIEVGRLTSCADIAYSVAIDAKANRHERFQAIGALITIGDSRLDRLTQAMVDDETAWPNDLRRPLLPHLFPAHLSVDRLCALLACIPEKPRSVGDLSWHLPRVIDAVEGAVSDALRECLVKLISEKLIWQKELARPHCSRMHLVPALIAVCLRQLQLGRETQRLIPAAVLALRLSDDQYGRDERKEALSQILAGASAAARRSAFWADDTLIQELDPQTNPWSRYAHAAFHGPIQLRADQDASWITDDLSDQHRSSDERAMLLQAAIQLWTREGEWADHIVGLKGQVSDLPELVAHLDERLKPSKEADDYKTWAAEHEKRNQQAESERATVHASWLSFWTEVANTPDIVFSSDRSANTIWNLWHAMSQGGDESRSSGWDRHFIESNFGKPTADRLRVELGKSWRGDCPTLWSERTQDQRHTYLVRWQLGLAAIAAEAEDPQWAMKLTSEEAALAARYVPMQLNGFPAWLEPLALAHPEQVDATLGGELAYELNLPAAANWHSILLQNVAHASPAIRSLFIPRLVTWLDRNDRFADPANDTIGAARKLERVLAILMAHADPATASRLRTTAIARLDSEISDALARVWLPILFRLDALAGIEALEHRLAGSGPIEDSGAIGWFAELFGDRHSEAAVNVRDARFSPVLLLRLLRLAYRIVCPENDAVHEGSYSPDTRDHAERGRDAILNALLEAPGLAGWEAKLELANDPVLGHFRDRAIAIAKDRLAHEADSTALSAAQIVALDRTGEAPPATRDAMFELMRDRLDDLTDRLLHDDSPRAAWALIKDEKIMRRVIAGELRHLANGAYKVDQEAATADEKETDIRMRSTASEHEAIIELKIGDQSRSARELRSTIKDQLVTKYMASEYSRAGCLLVTISSDKGWEHPDSGQQLDFGSLIVMLDESAVALANDLAGSVRLCVRGLDLRPRLMTERLSKVGK